MMIVAMMYKYVIVLAYLGDENALINSYRVINSISQTVDLYHLHMVTTLDGKNVKIFKIRTTPSRNYAPAPIPSVNIDGKVCQEDL